MLIIVSVEAQGETLALLTSWTVLPLVWTGLGSAQMKAVALLTNDHRSEGGPVTEFINLTRYIQQRSVKWKALDLDHPEDKHARLKQDSTEIKGQHYLDICCMACWWILKMCFIHIQIQHKPK